MASEHSDVSSSQSAYNDLRRMTPSLAAELDHLRASLREHNLWLQRFGHGGDDAAALAAVPGGLPVAVTVPSSASSAAPTTQPPGRQEPITEPPAQIAVSSDSEPPQEGHAQPTPGPEAETARETPEVAAASCSTANNNNNASPPPYAASDVPLYSSAVRDDVLQRRDQLMEWLKEGEDVLREYSARFAQLADELQLPAEDVLGTWNEAAPDNTLPDYTMIERREELLVGGVGEVPPVYERTSRAERP